MIQHKYNDPSDNLAQWEADQNERQEVTHEFMQSDAIAGNIDYCWFWRGDDTCEFGLDPWRIVDDFEYFVKEGTRVFLQRSDLRRLGLPEGEISGWRYWRDKKEKENK